MRKRSIRLRYVVVGTWIVVGCASLAARSAVGEDIYKSTDAEGRPVYSDRPLSSSAERLTIPTKPRSSAAAQAQAATELAELARRQEERDRHDTADKAEKERKAAAEKERAERCSAARNRYLMFTEANRLYRRDEAGNRVYYTGAEIDTEREVSRRQMEQACASEQR